MRIELETVTPKRAAALLQHNTSNRPMRKRWIERLAKAITDGAWQENGETIKLNGKELIDGQHRLAAIVMAGKSVKAWVAYGVPKSAYDTIDQGHTRTLADVLARQHESNYIKLAAAIRWIKTLYGRNPCRDRVTVPPYEAQEILRRHPGLRDSVSYGTSAPAAYLLSQSLLGALHYLFSRKDKEMAQWFFDRLGDGDGLTKDMPLWRLRDRLIRLKADQAKLLQETVAAFVIKTWNATRTNSTLGVLKFTEGESMPTIV